jgi:hypothetical protein
MALLGLDVGFSATRATSGLAFALGNDCILRRTTAAEQDRKRVLGDLFRADVTAIDAPLLSTLDGRVRTCEQLFASGRFQARCKPGFSHVPGTGQDLRRAGSESARQLQSVTSSSAPLLSFPRVFSAVNFVEAFPNAFLGLCLPNETYLSMPKLRRGQKFDWLYDQWGQDELFVRLASELQAVLPGSFASACARTEDHELRAALVCLATAACVAAGRYTAVGDESGGYFFLAPWSLWADWARSELDRLRGRHPSVSVWLDGRRVLHEAPLAVGAA